MKAIDYLIFALAAVCLGGTLFYYFTDHATFSNWFAKEDGPVEYGTALFLLFASLVLLRNAVAINSSRGIGPALLCGFYALLFFFGAGEEISWGQRIFDWETGAFFQQVNTQGETNIHNLKIGNVRLVKTLFGSGLSIVLLCYLIGLPLLYDRVPAIARLCDRFVVPVPAKRHMWLTLIATMIIIAVQMDRKWECYELIFGLLAFSIFLNPRNADQVT